MFCMTQWPNTDLGFLRVKTNDPDNLLCHRQKLTLVAGKLAQEAIIVSKNDNILIEIRALSLFFFPFWTKQIVEVILNFSIFPATYIRWRVWHFFSSHFSDCNSFMKILVWVLNSIAQLILELLIPILLTINFVNKK